MNMGTPAVLEDVEQIQLFGLWLSLEHTHICI